MLVKNIDKRLEADIIESVRVQHRNPVFKKFYQKKAYAIEVLNALLSGEAYSRNIYLIYVYTGYDEYVVLLTDDNRIYKNKVTCVSADSISTMIKEVMRDLFPDF